MPYGGGVHGALYHSQSNESYFTSTVGLKVVAPGTPADAYGLLKASVRDPDPVMYFEHKKTYRLFKGEVPDDGDGVVPIGVASVAREGTDLSIIGYGYMRHCALEAAETLATEGISAEVIDLRTLRPLDSGAILTSVAKTGRALVVHEANGFGGFGGEIAALIAEQGFDHLDAPVTRLTGPEVPGVPYAHDLEEWFMLNPERIAEAARRLASF
jgi:2-oxoisovalerate dehydrogenase E1 component beta subunit